MGLLGELGGFHDWQSNNQLFVQGSDAGGEAVLQVL